MSGSDLDQGFKLYTVITKVTTSRERHTHTALMYFFFIYY